MLRTRIKFDSGKEEVKYKYYPDMMFVDYFYNRYIEMEDTKKDDKD